MRKWITRISLIVAVIALCLLFASKSVFWYESTSDKISNITVDDIEITIVDEETVRIENTIKDSKLLYTWYVTKEVSEKTVESTGMALRDDFDVVEFYYEKLETVTFQAVVVYDGMQYVSNTFYLDSDGGLSQSEEDTSSVSTTEDISRDISDIVSLAYICFILAMVIVYYVVPKRFQWMVLLISSVTFYILSGIQYIIFIIVATVAAFIIAKQMSAKKQIADQLMKDASDRKTKKEIKLKVQKENKQLLWLGLIVVLGIMVVIKYSSFALTNVNALLGTDIPILSLIMPLGLSFYTFMIIAYLIDVSRGKYVAEENFAKFFLFASFFPHVSQGPISRYDEVAPQLCVERKFEFENLCLASQRILWGFFVKLVLADRIAILVNGVYDTYATQSWFMLIVASIAYSIQVYADFYSSMEIAIGTAQLFGIRLQENFLRPYFSTTMPEFWRRWHVTLGTWFKDYVFYPISISKKLMKFTVKVRKKFGPNVARVIAAIPPIMGVWILTGLWHGASWKFVAWGTFHGLLILLSTAFSQNVQNVLVKIGVKIESWDYKILQMVKVFMLCTIGRVFFRAETFDAAIQIFWKIVSFSHPNGTLSFSLIDLNKVDYGILLIAILMLLTVSVLQEKIGSVREIIGQTNIWIRWAVWIGLIFAVLLFGVYGPGTVSVFIYEVF